MSEITIAPVSILVNGANKVERQMSVVRQAGGSALTACLSIKGSVGKEIRESAARGGLVDVAQHAATGNYKPLAEMLAIRTGEPILISSRATFEALPDIFAAKVEQAKLLKDGGMRFDKKTGVMVEGARLKGARELHKLVSDITAYVAKVHAERQAAKVEGGLRRAA
jgi:hypothetical protein